MQRENYIDIAPITEIEVALQVLYMYCCNVICLFFQ